MQMIFIRKQFLIFHVMYLSQLLQFQIGNQRKNYREDKKMSKEISITFKQNVDILEKISKHKKRPRLVIGFSAETSKLITNSKKKLHKKNCDWIIANNVKQGEVFGSSKNKVSLITKNSIKNWPEMKKSQVAKKITKKIVNFLKNKLIQ